MQLLKNVSKSIKSCTSHKRMYKRTLFCFSYFYFYSVIDGYLCRGRREILYEVYEDYVHLFDMVVIQ